VEQTGINNRCSGELKSVHTTGKLERVDTTTCPNEDAYKTICNFQLSIFAPEGYRYEGTSK
jgi:hypothetical protein